VIAFKLPLAFLHPLPYPSPIKGRGEIFPSLLNSAVRLLIYNLQFAIKKFLSPLRGRELERGGDCIQVASCIPSPSPLSLSHQRARGNLSFPFKQCSAPVNL